MVRSTSCRGSRAVDMRAFAPPRRRPYSCVSPHLEADHRVHARWRLLAAISALRVSNHVLETVPGLAVESTNGRAIAGALMQSDLHQFWWMDLLHIFLTPPCPMDTIPVYMCALYSPFRLHWNCLYTGDEPGVATSWVAEFITWTLDGVNVHRERIKGLCANVCIMIHKLLKSMSTLILWWFACCRYMQAGLYSSLYWKHYWFQKESALNNISIASKRKIKNHVASIHLCVIFIQEKELEMSVEMEKQNLRKAEASPVHLGQQVLAMGEPCQLPNGLSPNRLMRRGRARVKSRGRGTS